MSRCEVAVAVSSDWALICSAAQGNHTASNDQRAANDNTERVWNSSQR
jgi:hypothetical protein